jgi:hypothetical protein
VLAGPSNKVFDIGYNYLVRSTALQLTLKAVAYDLADPYNMPDSILNAMKATISRISHFDQNELFGSVGFDAGNGLAARRSSGLSVPSTAKSSMQRPVRLAVRSRSDRWFGR